MLENLKILNQELKAHSKEIESAMDEFDHIHYRLQYLEQERDLYETQQSYLQKKKAMDERRINDLFNSIKQGHECLNESHQTMVKYQRQI